MPRRRELKASYGPSDHDQSAGGCQVLKLGWIASPHHLEASSHVLSANRPVVNHSHPMLDRGALVLAYGFFIHASCQDFDGDGADGNHPLDREVFLRSTGPHLGSTATQQRAYSRRELLEHERFGDVVVGSGIERGHNGKCVVAGGDDHDR